MTLGITHQQSALTKILGLQVSPGTILHTLLELGTSVQSQMVQTYMHGLALVAFCVRVRGY